MTKEIIESDVLIIGGGCAGDFAALKAAQAGASVVLIDKTNVKSAGATGMCGGMDHFPAVRPPDGTILKDPNQALPTIEELAKNRTEALCGADAIYPLPFMENITYQDSWDIVLELEEMGVKMREEDGSAWIIYQPEIGWATLMMRGAEKGAELMYKLAQALKKQGVKVFNRTMAVDLLTHDGAVTGAVAVDVRTGGIKVIKAKSVVVATGVTTRQYIGEPGLPSLFCQFGPPSADGSSHALPYRAGAEIVNCEFVSVTVGNKGGKVPFNGGGAFSIWEPGTPPPRLVNAKGEAVIPEGTFGSLVDELNEVQMVDAEAKKGNGPFFLDCRHLSEEQIQQIERCFAHEGPIALKWMKELGIDLRKDLLEYHIVYDNGYGGVYVDANEQSTIKGLFAAGDATGGDSGLSGACVFGARAGRNAAKYASEVGEVAIDDEQVKTIEEIINAPLKMKNGYKPLDVETEARSVMTKYAGLHRTEESLKNALQTIMRLNEKVMPKVSAKNPHELMRAMELRNIMLTCEMTLRAGLERRETRIGGFEQMHVRDDYPETKPEFNKLLSVRKVDGEMKVAFTDKTWQWR